MQQLYKDINGNLKGKTKLFDITVTLQPSGKYLVTVTCLMIFTITFEI